MAKVKLNHKDRRHDGREWPRYHERIPQKEFLGDPELMPNEQWNDWDDRRDGFRDWFSDGSKNKHKLVNYWGAHTFYSEHVEKIKKRTDKNKLLNERRRLMKTMRPR